jgi:hypothetical protein
LLDVTSLTAKSLAGESLTAQSLMAGHTGGKN